MSKLLAISKGSNIEVYANQISMQEAKVSGIVAYIDGLWSVKDKLGKLSIGKGVRVNKNCPAGNICVHLVGDPDDSYEIYDLDSGDKEGFVFDRIKEIGTTIDLTKVKILLTY